MSIRKLKTDGVTYAEYKAALAHVVLGTETAFDFKLPPGLVKFAAELKAEFNDLAQQFKVGLKDVVKAFSQRDVFMILKGVGFNLGLIWKALQAFTKLVPSGLMHAFSDLEKTGAFQKLKDKTIKVDEILHKYAVLRRLSGIALGGFLLWVWLSMAFTGNVDFDFSLDTVIEALRGNFNLVDLFESPEGLTMLTLLAAGLFTGISFVWLSQSIQNLVLAFVYTGAKKLNITRLSNNLVEKVMRPIRV